jgi:hypothetical protein
VIWNKNQTPDADALIYCYGAPSHRLFVFVFVFAHHPNRFGVGDDVFDASSPL